MTSLFTPINIAPYITHTGYDKHRANKVITNHHADPISFGVPFIATPNLIQRFELNIELNQPDPSCFYVGYSTSYTDYPSLT